MKTKPTYKELQQRVEALEKAEVNRMRTEEVLRESEKRLLTIFEQGPVGMALTEIDYRWLMVNQTLCDIAGYTREEMLKLRCLRKDIPTNMRRNILRRMEQYFP